MSSTHITKTLLLGEIRLLLSRFNVLKSCCFFYSVVLFFLTNEWIQTYIRIQNELEWKHKAAENGKLNTNTAGLYLSTVTKWWTWLTFHPRVPQKGRRCHKVLTRAVEAWDILGFGLLLTSASRHCTKHLNLTELWAVVLHKTSFSIPDHKPAVFAPSPIPIQHKKNATGHSRTPRGPAGIKISPCPVKWPSLLRPRWTDSCCTPQSIILPSSVAGGQLCSVRQAATVPSSPCTSPSSPASAERWKNGQMGEEWG